MNSPLLALLIPVAISAIAEVAKKYDIAPKVAVGVLSLVAGFVYYISYSYAPYIVEQVVTIVVGSIGVATAIYEYVIKYFKEK